MIVKDTKVNDNTGQFIDWRLNLWGEAIDGSSQPLHPFPTEHDDDHTIEDAIVATTSVQNKPTKTQPPHVPSEAVDRPVNAKPSETAEPAPIEPPEPRPPMETPTPIPTSTPVSESFLPSFLPTFGASKRTQAWIYAAIGSIIVFCIGLGVYFQVQRRRRAHTNPHDDYDFEVIEDEDELHAMTGLSGRTQRRGGELYNAFAGESDEEIFSDDDDGPYKDHNPQESSEQGYDQPEK